MAPVDAFSREELALLVRDLLQVNAEQQARILRLEEEIARLRGGEPPSAPPGEASDLPSFVKPNRKPKDAPQYHPQSKPPRKPRPQASPASLARRRETPTRVLEHFPDSCPDSCSVCGRKLKDGWLQANRQVIEI